MPPVIKNGLVPRNGEESAAEEGPPAHRVQLARALADAVVGAIEAGDAEGARVAVGMLERVVGKVVVGK